MSQIVTPTFSIAAELTPKRTQKITYEPGSMIEKVRKFCQKKRVGITRAQLMLQFNISEGTAHWIIRRLRKDSILYTHHYVKEARYRTLQSVAIYTTIKPSASPSQAA